jgi:CO/xanthine dehydrogenase Mo-binding subunit
MEIWTRWGATRKGKLTAMEGKIYGDTGAYAGLGAFVVKRCGIFLGGPYCIPHVAVDSYSVYTNNIMASAMRGFGVVQAAVAHEAQMDELASRLNIHPLQLRIMNALKPGLSTATGQVLEEAVGIGTTLEKIRQAVLQDETLADFRKGLS